MEAVTQQARQSIIPAPNRYQYQSVDSSLKKERAKRLIEDYSQQVLQIQGRSLLHTYDGHTNF